MHKIKNVNVMKIISNGNKYFFKSEYGFYVSDGKCLRDKDMNEEIDINCNLGNIQNYPTAYF